MMLTGLHQNRNKQLVIGLTAGIIFGFLLQKSGGTQYDLIIQQLLLTDFTVVKIMLSAVIVGMLGVHMLKSFGLVNLHPKSGSIGSTIVGGLIFGVGFATLGYCPGTAIAAAAQGSLDALLGGLTGILLGSGLFAAIYPKLEKGILSRGSFGDVTLPTVLKLNRWFAVVPVVIILIILLLIIEKAGL